MRPLTLVTALASLGTTLAHFPFNATVPHAALAPVVATRRPRTFGKRSGTISAAPSSARSDAPSSSSLAAAPSASASVLPNAQQLQMTPEQAFKLVYNIDTSNFDKPADYIFDKVIGQHAYSEQDAIDEWNKRDMPSFTRLFFDSFYQSDSPDDVITQFFASPAIDWVVRLALHLQDGAG
jgi:hypothetical protein